MAEIVSSAFLSAFLQSLFDRLDYQAIKNLFQGKKLIEKQLEDLKILLLSADKLLDYAEARQIEDLQVKMWLDELKEVVYVADELMDKVNNEALRREVEVESSSSVSKVLSKLIPSSFNAFDNSVSSELEEILHKLKFLMDQRGALGLKESREKKHFHRLPAPLVEESDVYGRDSVKEAIVESLLLDDHASGNDISVIPIVGIGGIGKTTLAQLVYDDRRVKEHFNELRVWVTVSTDFDLSRITKTIFEKVTSRSCSIQDIQEVRFLLKEALTRTKFLIVLDDVWNENYDEWDVLRSSFISGMCGSKIIVTTRSATVASIMATQESHRLSELSEEDCWRLFTKHAFKMDENLEEHSDLQEIGKEVVKKCKGHPLAIKSLGGVLRSERNLRKWKEILKSNMWELNRNMSSSVLPALWLSYYYLPWYLKRCFAYCSVFPKDYHFEREEMILLWMAEGFLQHEAARSRVEDVGEQYFEDLISRSLLQRSNQYESYYVMHDLVHDLAIYVSGEFCSHSDDEKLLHGIEGKTRHFSCNLAIDDLKKFEGLSKAKCLHTFIQFKAIKLREPTIYLELLTTIGCLRVLSIDGTYIKELPSSIGNLKNLRYLKLSSFKIVTLPDSICTLYNLETLILWDCKNLEKLPFDIGRQINLRHLCILGSFELRSICWPEENLDQFPGSICNLKQLNYLCISCCFKFARLPTNMSSLTNLRHLDIRFSPLEEMPPHMCNLKDLETLSDFVLNKNGGSNIKELGGLQQLRGTLHISGLQNVIDIEDAIRANLKDKRSLNELALKWNGHTDDSIHERDLLQALHPPTNLREITIVGYGGTSFPPWVGNVAFSKMVSVVLSQCQNCCFLPPLGKLPFLRDLRIRDFHALETISDEFYGCDSPFKSLEELSFENMPEWSKWSFIEGKKDDAFPRLKTLHLNNCPKLSGELPITSHPIETLAIEKCGKIEFLENNAFSSLRNLTIESVQSLKFFPLENAPKLDVLTLEDCESSECCLFLQESFPALQSLHRMSLNGWPKLVSFPKVGFPALNMKVLQISRCENLKSLPEQINTLLLSLEILYVIDCPKIKSFPAGGLPPNLKNLKIKGCHELISTCAHWDLRGLISLESLTVGGYEEVLDSFPPDGLLPTSVTSFTLRKFSNLKALNSNAFQRLTYLEIVWCPELLCLPEESLLNSLKALWIHECPLLEKRHRIYKGEGWPKISHIPIVSIEGRTTGDYE